METAQRKKVATDETDPFRTCATPTWYKNAKFGIFIHWGPSSVPAWAPRTSLNVQQMMKEKGITSYFKCNPYAEWYFNTMRVPGSPTQLHHLEHWGCQPYEVFGEMFNDSMALDIDERLATWADLFARAGARYVVPVTKHHDGFTLWPSDVPPKKKNWQAKVDLIGMLQRHVLEKKMRFGVYYSGLYDWTWNAVGIRNPFTAAINGYQSPAIVAYMDGHMRELIDRYQPSLLWNDIGYVTHPNHLPMHSMAFKTLADLWGYYYAAVPDGVIDDRWFEIPAKSRLTYGLLHCLTKYFTRPGSVWLADGIDALLKCVSPAYDRPAGGLTFPLGEHFDYRTYEYETPEDIQCDKWELVRGIGLSFCYNQNENPSEQLTFDKLVMLFVDVVSKNGNLLLNVGPKADGSLQEGNIKLLEAFGAWMETFGEAIYDSTPWGVLDKYVYAHPDDPDTADIVRRPTIRFVEKNGGLYVFFTIPSEVEEFLIPHLRPSDAATVVKLWVKPGQRVELIWKAEEAGMRLTLPRERADSPLQCVSIQPIPSWNG